MGVAIFSSEISLSYTEEKIATPVLLVGASAIDYLRGRLAIKVISFLL